MGKGRDPKQRTTDQRQAVPATRVEVASGVGQRTQAPFVELVVSGHKEQLTPAKAREIAGLLLAAADAAESDGFVLTFLRRLADLDERQAAIVLGEFRAYREAERRRQQRHDYPPESTV